MILFWCNEWDDQVDDISDWILNGCIIELPPGHFLSFPFFLSFSLESPFWSNFIQPLAIEKRMEKESEKSEDEEEDGDLRQKIDASLSLFIPNQLFFFLFPFAC